jgi:hypothetical protein
MTSNLRAEPKNRGKLELGTSLKFALRKRYGQPIDTDMDESDLNFIEGLIAAGHSELIADAQKLYQYITRHERIHIKEEY